MKLKKKKKSVPQINNIIFSKVCPYYKEIYFKKNTKI